MYAINGRIKDLLNLINEYRASKGLGILHIDPKLTAAAQWMAEDLAVRIDIGHNHTDSRGRNLAQRLAVFGVSYNMLRSENFCKILSRKDAKGAFDAWRGSSGHNLNLLYPEFTKIGVGYALSLVNGGIFENYYDCWVTVFGNEES